MKITTYDRLRAISAAANQTARAARRVAALGLLSALGAFAVPQVASADIVACERTRLSTAGFSTRSAAGSWFPELIWFDINGSAATGFYGQATVEPDGNRQLLRFDLDSVAVMIRYFPSQQRASAWLDVPSGYEHTTPSAYRCAS